MISDELLTFLRSLVGFEDVQTEDIFLCTPENPYTELVKETYRVTLHDPDDSGVCVGCGMICDNE